MQATMKRTKPPVNAKIEDSGFTVYKTENYSIFQNIRENRNLNETQVEKLAESMVKNGFLIDPITVNSYYEVIDGQHRLEAAKRTNSPVFFIQASGYGSQEMRELNLNQSNWTSKDYLKFYCEKGHEDYLTLQRFWEQNKEFSLTSCIKLLQNNNAKRSRFQRFGKRGFQPKQVFEEGTWEVGDEQVAIEWANRLKLIGNYYDGYRRDGFVSVMIQLFGNVVFSWDRFYRKLEIQPRALKDCANRAQWLDLLEEIYNYNAQSKISLKYLV